MPNPTKPLVVALEEHYADPDIILSNDMNRRDPLAQRRLNDFDALRIGDMDKAGIDIQVLSHIPWRRAVNAELAIELAAQANNRLAESVKAKPSRFFGFATLPMQDPSAAADELERSVSKLGFVGAMVFPSCDGVFLDDKRNWPLFERAAALDVPLYLHPGQPHETVTSVYYQDYVEEFRGILGAAWGFTVETSTSAVRLVLSRAFEAHPNLKIILGHMGESIPFSLGRVDEAFSRPGNSPISFREVFCNNFWITTSGHFNTSALLCSILELGIDRIMFSVDYPYVENEPGMEWMATVPLCAEDKEKVLGGNAKRLLKL